MFETMFTSPAALSRNRNGLLAAEVELARRRRPSKPVRPTCQTCHHPPLPLGTARLDTDDVPRFPVISPATRVMLASKSLIAMSAST